MDILNATSGQTTTDGQEGYTEDGELEAHLTRLILPFTSIDGLNSLNGLNGLPGLNSLNGLNGLELDEELDNMELEMEENEGLEDRIQQAVQLQLGFLEEEDVPEWSADRLNSFKTFEDLILNKAEILVLLNEQGDVPGLQDTSETLVTNSILDKTQTWSNLLRRCFTLFSTFCTQLDVPIFPIHPIKVALFLARIGPEPELPPSLPGRDLRVDLLDPQLEPQPFDPNEKFSPILNRGPSSSGPKPKKHLSRKTAEQYLNRLTALRTPTLVLWKNRTGLGENEPSLQTSEIVEDCLSRMGGESARDVKRRARERRRMRDDTDIGGTNQRKKRGREMDLQVDLQVDDSSQMFNLNLGNMTGINSIGLEEIPIDPSLFSMGIDVSNIEPPIPYDPNLILPTSLPGMNENISSAISAAVSNAISAGVSVGTPNLIVSSDSNARSNSLPSAPTITLDKEPGTTGTTSSGLTTDLATRSTVAPTVTTSSTSLLPPFMSSLTSMFIASRDSNKQIQVRSTATTSTLSSTSLNLNPSSVNNTLNLNVSNSIGSNATPATSLNLSAPTRLSLGTPIQSKACQFGSIASTPSAFGSSNGLAFGALPSRSNPSKDNPTSTSTIPIGGSGNPNKNDKIFTLSPELFEEALKFLTSLESRMNQS